MIRVRRMTLADLPLGMRLKEQARWNQTEADWRRQIELEPEGCFVAEADGVPRGTTCTCVFGPVAWVATVLVDATVRRQGIGTALVEHALEHLDGRGITSVRLDATPLGRPLYEKLGFVAQFELARWEGLLPSSPPVAGVTPLQADLASPHEPLLRLDRQTTATDRSKLLLRLFAERSDSFRTVVDGDRVLGFLTSRPGANATQLGPCIGESLAGPLLLADAFHRHAGQKIYLDTPLANLAAMEIAGSRGLTVQRHFLRMCRGESVQEDTQMVWGSSGPEKG